MNEENKMDVAGHGRQRMGGKINEGGEIEDEWENDDDAG
jgi:hypothetical protein